MTPLCIAFCYNVKSLQAGSVESELDYDLAETIDAIAETVEALGHKVIRVEADDNAWEHLRDIKGEVDLVFNMAEGMRGDARESIIPQYCEALKIPYTHSTPTVLAICLDKYLTRLAVKGAGFRVPEAILIQNGHLGDMGLLKFPVIIKPNGEGSSIGIFDANVVDDKKALDKRLKELRQQGLAGELLIEEYIEGREFTVGVLGNPPEVLPIIEQRFDFLPKGMRKIAGYELKWVYEDKLTDLSQAFYCPPPLKPEQASEIKATTEQIFRALKIRDCARIDYRMDSEGKLYFIEANPIPGINPSEAGISYFPLASRKAGYKFPDLIEKIINSARARYGI